MAAAETVSNGSSQIPPEDSSSRLQDSEIAVAAGSVTVECPNSNEKASHPPKGTEATSGPTPQSNRSKKKEDKSIEHILKALSSLEKPEEKLAALCKKYADLLEEHRVLQTWSKQHQKKLTSVMREKDQLQTEHSRAILAKSKLESLCRELQRHNKLVKEESLARAREDEDIRKEVTAKFQSTISEIQQQVTENSSTNVKLREEKMELVGKLKTLIEKYELRDQHFDKVLKHKEIEHQLAEAKLAQTELVAKEQKELFEKEKQVMMEEAAKAQQKIVALLEQEQLLRSQVMLYTEKYEEFQETIKKSNDVFATFKSDTDQMTKQVKKLEKETLMWRTRWENSNKALLQMVEDKTKSDKEINLLHNKVKKLESLCRALQQRTSKSKEGEERESSRSPVNGTTISSNEGTQNSAKEGSPSASEAATSVEPTSVSSNEVSSTSEASPSADTCQKGPETAQSHPVEGLSEAQVSEGPSDATGSGQKADGLTQESQEQMSLSDATEAEESHQPSSTACEAAS